MVSALFGNGEDTKRVKVHKSLIEVFEEIRKGIAEDMKKAYGLTEITIPITLSSEILAAEKKGKKPIFNVRKTGLNKGVLELVWR
jgi:hypothetical protein